MLLVLDFRPGVHLEPGRGEDRLDPLERPRDRVHAADRLTAAGLRHVDRARLERGIELGAVEHVAARLYRGLDLLLGLVDRLSRRGTFRGRQRAELLQQRG